MKKFIIITSIAVITAIGADAPIATPDAVATTYTKTLTRLTDRPKPIGPLFGTMCRPPSDKGDKERFGPHDESFVHHYRNDLAKQPEGNFPSGSVLVKEKLVSRTKDADPVERLVTGMIKQPAGTSPKTGDWLFFVSRDGKVETGKMEGCAGCHTGAKRDNVFTDLPKR